MALQRYVRSYVFETTIEISKLFWYYICMCWARFEIANTYFVITYIFLKFQKKLCISSLSFEIYLMKTWSAKL